MVKKQANLKDDRHHQTKRKEYGCDLFSQDLRNKTAILGNCRNIYLFSIRQNAYQTDKTKIQEVSIIISNTLYLVITNVTAQINLTYLGIHWLPASTF